MMDKKKARADTRAILQTPHQEVFCMIPDSSPERIA